MNKVVAVEEVGDGVGDGKPLAKANGRKRKLGEEKQKSLDDCLVTWIASSTVPTRVVEDVNFKKLLRSLNAEVTSLDFNYVKPCFDLLQFSYNLITMTKGFSNLNRFVLTLTINFLTVSSSVLYKGSQKSVTTCQKAAAF